MRKHIVTLIFTVVLLIGGTTESFAASSSYKVQKGDTLYKIATTHKVSVNELKKWNDMKSNVIKPGQQLKIVKSDNKMKSKEAKKKIAKTPSRSDDDNVVKEITVNASAYTAYCNGCSGITSTGINLKRNPDAKVIAVDPTVIPLGTKVYVEGYGYAIAGDIGSAIKGNKIDLFFPTKAEAYKWGRKNVKIKILK
ncbi:LysM peptidoglycan-binding domain-containing protein [Sporosarcina sp. Sa2YVA2]|uniref:LysM peptidoglycan-binding domain-containing protein n=1 Tax=Sporosarcina quadrami TaxID=2762234 RepID=A0ABR8U8J9_9BACL|nr:3D domain-containing protein [Sporosarcina quadrami]MBD7984363.1 LysM peptidoglycan-binding domain-containing protein [Sporosarcina quadrami]